MWLLCVGNIVYIITHMIALVSKSSLVFKRSIMDEAARIITEELSSKIL